MLAVPPTEKMPASNRRIRLRRRRLLRALIVAAGATACAVLAASASLTAISRLGIRSAAYGDGGGVPLQEHWVRKSAGGAAGSVVPSDDAKANSATSVTIGGAGAVRSKDKAARISSAASAVGVNGQSGKGAVAATRKGEETAAKATVSSGASAAGASDVSVVSYSVYGNETRYLNSLLVNAEEHAPKFYPGWQVRVYHDASVPLETLSRLRPLAHVRLVNLADVGKPAEPLLPAEWREWLPKIAPTTWRFLVAADPTAERFVVRDTDALLEPREKAAVDEWIESGAPYHVMHDHPRHFSWGGENMTMLAGMWGGRRRGEGSGAPDIDMARLLREWYEDPLLGGFRMPATGARLNWDDQKFLAERLWPLIDAMGRPGSMRHNSFHCDSNDGVAFPTASTKLDLGNEAYDFVGMTKLFRMDEKKGTLRRHKPNVGGICTLLEAINEPPDGNEWRKRYEGCLRRREERGLKKARGTSDIPGVLRRCKATQDPRAPNQKFVFGAKRAK